MPLNLGNHIEIKFAQTLTKRLKQLGGIPTKNVLYPFNKVKIWVCKAVSDESGILDYCIKMCFIDPRVK